MPLQASTPEIHSQGSLRGGDPPPQRGVWGSVPPDPGSAPTRKICIPQVFIAYHLCLVQVTLIGVTLLPTLYSLD
jgi:hypothetical protein